ncbi:MAG: hypothetical protein Q7S21_01160 [archaeon]|nr:hypothetical protein [archaeon]
MPPKNKPPKKLKVERYYEKKPASKSVKPIKEIKADLDVCRVMRKTISEILPRIHREKAYKAKDLETIEAYASKITSLREDIDRFSSARKNDMTLEQQNVHKRNLSQLLEEFIKIVDEIDIIKEDYKLIN